MIVGIALATENGAEPAAHADRLFRLAVEGVSPQRAPDPMSAEDETL